MVEPFMHVIVECLRATDHSPDYCRDVARAFVSIGEARPELRMRYRRAVVSRDVGEIGRLLFTCQLELGRTSEVWIDNLRIMAGTGRLHIGHSALSAPVFPV